MRHPIQPLVKDEQGFLRFKKNRIVDFLLQKGGIDLNQLARMGFPKEDWEQFAQLIGYSLSGWGGLSYVSDEAYNTAEKMNSEGLDEKDARIATLEEMLENVRKGLRIAAPAVFRIHSEDLEP